MAILRRYRHGGTKRWTKPSKNMPGRKNTVVVVEDEIIIRADASYLLQEGGYQVLEAASAEEMLTLLSHNADKVGVLFTDMHLAGSLTGLQLAYQVRRNWPWIGLLLVSGKARLSIDTLPAGARFLTKPYSPRELLKNVSELLPGL